MSDGALRSVNVGMPRVAAWAGIGRTSIDKTPVAGPVEVHQRGLAGDQVSDTRHHGGPDQAVYAYSREELDWWSEQLGDELRDGEFGENLTTAGIDVDEAEVGERWRIGTVLLEVASVRTPCNDFKQWLGRGGHDNAAWVRRFSERERPGPYLRVLQPGVLAAGDPLEVVHRPGRRDGVVPVPGPEPGACTAAKAPGRGGAGEQGQGQSRGICYRSVAPVN